MHPVLDYTPGRIIHTTLAVQVGQVAPVVLAAPSPALMSEQTSGLWWVLQLEPVSVLQSALQTSGLWWVLQLEPVSVLQSALRWAQQAPWHTASNQHC